MMIKKIIIVFVFFLMSFCNPAPEIRDTDSTPIDVMGDPVQKMIVDAEIIDKIVDDGVIEITPLAEYEISAEVASINTYSSGWDGELVPVDLALIWGELTNSEIRDMVEYSQDHRWYHFKYSSDFPRDKRYIIEHSANNHIIPARENIRRALYKIAKGDLIKAKGYLVKIKGRINGRMYRWKSSLSRKDTAGNSCELFYIKELRVNDNIY